MNTITRPHYTSATLAAGRTWRGDANWLFTEKKDGVFAVREMFGAVFVGEQMRGGEFFAFDVVDIDGQDLRKRPLRERWQALQAFRSCGVQIVPAGIGGEFLEHVLANGGEGIVAADLEAAYGLYGARVKCKRVETFDCRIVAMGGSKRSVRVELDGQDCGWVPVFNHFDSLRHGMIVEIAAQCRHASGKLREARFVRVRTDKSPTS